MCSIALVTLVMVISGKSHCSQPAGTTWNNAKMSVRAKNMTLLADEIKFTDDTVLAKNISLKAAEFAMGNFFIGGKTTQMPVLSTTRSLEIVHYGIVDHPGLRSSVNKTLSPCDNFYEFVCDGWSASHHIRPYDLKFSQFALNMKKIQEQITQLFKNRGHYNDSRLNNMLFDAYDKCMNSAERNKSKSKAITDKLRVIRQANLKYVTDWLLLVKPMPLFYSVDVVTDVMNVTRNQLVLSPIGTLVTEEYYLDEDYSEQIEAFKQYLADIIEILIEDDTEEEFFKNDTEEVERRVNSFLEIETTIAEIMNASANDRDDHTVRYNLRSIKQIQKLAPSINWHRYLNGLLPKNIAQKVDLSQLEVNVIDPTTVEIIDGAVRRFSNMTLLDYLEWRIILSLVPFLDDRFRNAKKKFDKALLGQTDLQPMWLNCQNEVSFLLPDILNRLYIGEYFDNGSRMMLQEMIDNIKDSFAVLVEESAWMDSYVKVRALRKVNAIIPFIAYDDSLFNDTALEMKYAQFDLNTSSTYLEIARACNIHKYQQRFSRLLEMNDRKHFRFPPPEVNAFYDATHNQIALLVGILQGAFFDAKMPLSMNYGGIGVVIGHEITHGFDEGGRQYDEVGNLHNWWDDETKRNFIEHKTCFIDQYGAVEVPGTGGRTIDGEATQGENIADNGGLRAAFRAFKKALSESNTNEKRLKGLEEFNQEQLFFINYAYCWCGITRPEAAVDFLITDNHSPEQYRVNIVLGNQDEFLKAFNCAEGSEMHRQQQCRVW